MAVIDDMISALRKLGAKDIEEKIAKKAAPLLEAALKKTLAAGQTPEGKQWAPRKADGGRAYANAASKVTAKAYGSLVKATLTGPEVYAQYASHGIAQRQMLPDAGAAIPASVTNAIEEAARQVFEEAMK